MAGINVIRTWSDDVSLAAQRATEARDALAGLRTNPRALDDAMHAIGSGGGEWDDPFDVARDLAEQGNRGIWDGWVKSGAASTLLRRAATAHPGGPEVATLNRAHAIAAQTKSDLGAWIEAGGGSATFDAIEGAARVRLDEVRALAAQVLA